MIKVYCEPLFHEIYCYIRSADIDKALKEWGAGLYKVSINPMFLNPKSRYYLKYNFPKNIEVEENPGCAGWELRGWIKETTPETIFLDEGSQLINTPEVVEAFKKQHQILKDFGKSGKTSITEVLNRPDKKQNGKDSVGNPLPRENALPTPESPKFLHPTQSPKLKSDKTTAITTDKTKHAGGRPRKTGNFSERTFYRRQKEKQGILL